MLEYFKCIAVIAAYVLFITLCSGFIPAVIAIAIVYSIVKGVYDARKEAHHED